MNRMHIHVGVDDLDQGIAFYSALFGAEPSKVKEDYAKWMLEDPRINFAISTHVKNGVDHLGLQVDSAEELAAVRARIEAADMTTFDEGETVCCYARAEKTWVKDTAGVPWEAYHTMEDAELFSGREKQPSQGACCA